MSQETWAFISVSSQLPHSNRYSVMCRPSVSSKGSCLANLAASVRSFHGVFLLASLGQTLIFLTLLQKGNYLFNCIVGGKQKEAFRLRCYLQLSERSLLRHSHGDVRMEGELRKETGNSHTPEGIYKSYKSDNECRLQRELKS